MPTRLACTLPRTSSSGSTDKEHMAAQGVGTDSQAALLWHRVLHLEVRHHIVIIC